MEKNSVLPCLPLGGCKKGGGKYIGRQYLFSVGGRNNYPLSFIPVSHISFLCGLLDIMNK